ncbi:hypothetical protein BGZ96_011080 [Linnemannia gamsii]|uniref:Protein phosphatase inhibitor 2 n=1 Tax=Linnemannia gamsii TaxID=64522 RepID=A0ABQ7JTS4_9FUNG|nr:hypothetical protein BGZ96_011080 [Linnemannia gamsii]
MSHSPPHVRHSPVLSAQPTKGILKRPATQQGQEERAPRLKWDEENLTITEAQKDSTMKIDEPKTPYVHYDHELDKVIELDDSFQLDGQKKKHPALAHTPPVPSYMEGLKGEDEEDEEGEEEDDEEDEWDSEDDDDEPPSKKIDHDKFAKMRAEHYHMKEALQLGHKLAEEELDALDSPPVSAGPVPPLPSFALKSNQAIKGRQSNKDSDVLMS